MDYVVIRWLPIKVHQRYTHSRYLLVHTSYLRGLFCGHVAVGGTRAYNKPAIGLFQAAREMHYSTVALRWWAIVAAGHGSVTH